MKQMTWKSSGLKSSFLFAHSSVGPEVGKDAGGCSCLIHVVPVGSAGARGSTPKMASLFLCLGLPCPWPPFFSPHGNFFSLGSLLHMVWASLRMVVSEPSLFPCGSQRAISEPRLKLAQCHFHCIALVRTATSPASTYQEEK